MMPPAREQLNVAIACGGTGGHLFPGLAVAGQLANRNVAVTLLISPKEIDQLAVRAAGQLKVVTLPAVGLTPGRGPAFVRGFIQSYRAAARLFAQHPPQAALAMGGFTSAPPILAARRFKAATFLHESNSIPGRANRWLSWMVDKAFVGFPFAAGKLHCRRVTVTGTPVREKFQKLDASVCRLELGLDEGRPVVLVMGGSQGARGINELVLRSLPLLAREGPDWQWVHLAGQADVEKLKQGYQNSGLKASVHPFFPEMELAMGAATVCISRAGASSLAELAAMRLPAVLIPYPSATDNHQFHNAHAFEKTGAAKLLDQQRAGPEDLRRAFVELMQDDAARRRMQTALAAWHAPQAANEIAQAILESVDARTPSRSTAPSSPSSNQPDDQRTRCSPISGEFSAMRPGRAFEERSVA